MAGSQSFFELFLLFSIFDLNLGKYAEVILGDPFTFPQDECKTESRLVKTLGQDITRSVAVGRNSTWTPDDYYRDRVNQDSSVTFSRTVFTDTGTYELTCDDDDKFTVIQLKIVPLYEPWVKEGEEVKLMCNYDCPGKDVKSVKWTKDGKLVLEHNFTSDENKYGTRSKEGKVSVSPNGFKEGDLSLTMRGAQEEDAGDYICSVHTGEGQNGKDESVTAVRVTVINRSVDHTTDSTEQPLNPDAPKEKQMETWLVVLITAALMLLVLAPVFTLFGWWLKSRRSSVSSLPGYQDVP
ncbi:uncharacterized protein LOC113157800 [Anabas testudineus]|uniref:uncharacterized protein LOC113157800 n=1 Tax=Anabas testudineus TaxID=64144 RepID=UPI000E45B5D4|nr:uncharacterized protein LOC113157800 [Anabas testudineus]